MTANPSTDTATPPRTLPTRNRLLTIAAAVVAGVVVWVVAALAGIRLEVTSPVAGTIAITLPLVIGTIIVVGFAAWLVLALLERRGRNTRRTWTIIALAILAVSVLSLFFLDSTAGARIALVVMHLVVGLLLTFLLPRANARGSLTRTRSR